MEDFAITNGEKMSPCENFLFKKGATALISSLGKDRTESTCQLLREKGYAVDWCWYRNRAHVKTREEDVEKIKEEWWGIWRGVV